MKTLHLLNLYTHPQHQLMTLLLYFCPLLLELSPQTHARPPRPLHFKITNLNLFRTTFNV